MRFPSPFYPIALSSVLFAFQTGLHKCFRYFLKKRGGRIWTSDLSVLNVARSQAGLHLILAPSGQQNEDRKDVYNRGIA